MSNTEPTIRVRNWAKFQHFKDRRPPWIKLYRELLDDRHWHAISGDISKTLIGLWLLASEDKGQSGELPDIDTIAFRLRMGKDVLIQHLSALDGWLDNNVISERHQVGPPETETETETETDSLVNARRVHVPCVEIVDLYHARLPQLPKVVSLSKARKDAIRRRWLDEFPTLDHWDAYFEAVTEQPFLLGEGKARTNGDTWTAYFDWLLKPTNLLKVVERTYNRGTGNAH